VGDSAIPAGEPIWELVEPARPVTAEERAVLAVLVDAVGSPRLRVQLADVVVGGTCRCGCSSVQLTTMAPRLPADEVLRLTDGRRDDHLAVTARRVSDVEPPVTLTLHVLNGRLAELELYVTDGVRLPLPDASSLIGVHVDA
jgi:hypothetical protein